MNRGILSIILSLFVLTLYPCDCEWTGDFYTASSQTDLVIKAQILSHSLASSDINEKMEVCILERYKGFESSDTIVVWGDNGAECRPYVDEFISGEIYYLALDIFEGRYIQHNCGELYLRLSDNIVYGDRNVRQDLPQIGLIKEKEFESKLKRLFQPIYNCIPEVDTLDRKQVFLIVEEMPKFKEDWKRRIMTTHYDLTQPEIESNYYGRIDFTFVIDTLGFPRNICVIKSKNMNSKSTLDSQLREILESLVNWTPGKMNNKKVPVRFIENIRFEP